MKYRKKSVIIDAFIWNGMLSEIPDEFKSMDFRVSNLIRGYNTEDCLKIKTLEGTMIANIGDYIIKGVKGEFYPCNPDIFELTYEKVLT